MPGSAAGELLALEQHDVYGTVRLSLFDEVIADIRPNVVIDVGVWKGGSTIYLAELLRANGVAGMVISVDTFLGSLEHWNRNSELFTTVYRRNGMPLRR